MDGTKKSNQAYRSVGEVASELGVATHVLRYWETKFPKYIAPVKRGVGRRYYRPQDVTGAKAVDALINRQGLTIKGALQVLSEQSLEAIIGAQPSSSDPLPEEVLGESTPEESTPEESTPEESTPEESTPEESTPEESTPEEKTPVESTSAESTPAESTPAESTPVETEKIVRTSDPEQLRELLSRLRWIKSRIDETLASG